MRESRQKNQGRSAFLLGFFLMSTLFILCGQVALAQQFGIQEVTYAEIEEFTPVVINFEQFSGGSIDGILSLSGVSFAERFEGQTLQLKQDDQLVWHETLDKKSPSTPLHLIAGRLGHNLSVDYDSHWQSQSLYPLGPKTAGKEGTGALAILFDEPVCSLAFRTAVDGMSRLGVVNNVILRGKDEGSLNIRFYDSNGHLIASFMRSYNPEGLIEVGYLQSGQAEAEIAALFVQNLDLGGIALDDFRFDPVCPFKLF